MALVCVPPWQGSSVYYEWLYGLLSEKRWHGSQTVPSQNVSQAHMQPVQNLTQARWTEDISPSKVAWLDSLSLESQHRVLANEQVRRYRVTWPAVERAVATYFTEVACGQNATDATKIRSVVGRLFESAGRQMGRIGTPCVSPRGYAVLLRSAAAL